MHGQTRAPVAFDPRNSRGHTPRPRGAAHKNLASDVVRRLERIEHDEGGSGDLILGTGALAVSNLGKVFFPAAGQTKGDLMRYYARVSPWLLPAIADRPLVMKRYPNGVEGKSFYQQKAPANPPAGVRVESVADEGIEAQDRVIGGDLATLLYVVQLGAISIDPWHSRAESLGYADYSVIDLDPGPRASFARVVEVARRVRDELEELGLSGVCKTSGASGVHVFLPLAPETTNEAARLVAQIVANRVARARPKDATVLRAVKSRPPASVYVDYLQNIRGKTVAGVYSARAEPTATVSTPLRWDEVSKGLDPRDFTISNVPGRVEEVGDLWAAAFRRRNDLRSLLEE